MWRGTMAWARDAWVISWDMHIMAMNAISRGSEIVSSSLGTSSCLLLRGDCGCSGRMVESSTSSLMLRSKGVLAKRVNHVWRLCQDDAVVQENCRW